MGAFGPYASGAVEVATRDGGELHDANKVVSAMVITSRLRTHVPRRELTFRQYLPVTCSPLLANVCSSPLTDTRCCQPGRREEQSFGFGYDRRPARTLVGCENAEPVCFAGEQPAQLWRSAFVICDLVIKGSHTWPLVCRRNHAGKHVPKLVEQRLTDARLPNFVSLLPITRALMVALGR